MPRTAKTVHGIFFCYISLEKKLYSKEKDYEIRNFIYEIFFVLIN